MRVEFTGIDPGLVHSGLVTFKAWPKTRRFTMRYEVVESIRKSDGTIDIDATARLIGDKTAMLNAVQNVFIEKYEPRSNFSTDARMQALVRETQRETRITNPIVLSNKGSKSVLKRPLLQLLHLDKFPTTHHQDLQAAARIGLFGALKDKELNEFLAQFVIDHKIRLDPWSFE